MEGTVSRPVGSSFGRRVVGALLLNPATFGEVAGDDDATWQAFAVLAATVLVSVDPAGTDLARLMGDETSTGVGVFLAASALGAFLATAVALVFWAGLLAVVANVGLAGPDVRGEFRRLLRALGFASAPSGFSILALAPTVGPMFGIVVVLWTFAANILAVRGALGVTSRRALAVLVGAWVVLGVLALLWWALFRSA